MNVRDISLITLHCIHAQRPTMMHSTQLRLLSLFLWIATAAGTANLLTFVEGNIGNVLGTAFGEPGTNATFDYVIVGGGTGGLTIATRLASDPAISVAVIEAGGFYEIDNGNRSVVPGYANYYTGSDPNNYQPLIDWGFTTVPQTVRLEKAEFCIGMDLAKIRSHGAGRGQSQSTLRAWEDFGRFLCPELYDLSPVSLRKIHFHHVLCRAQELSSQSPDPRKDHCKNGQTRLAIKATLGTTFCLSIKNHAIIPHIMQPSTTRRFFLKHQVFSILLGVLCMSHSAIMLTHSAHGHKKPSLRWV